MIKVYINKTKSQRLKAIRNIIEEVDNRCMAVDGPVSETRQEITSKELRMIYLLAGGEPTIAKNTKVRK